MADDDNKTRAINAVGEKLKALAFATQHLRDLRDNGGVDAAYANAKLGELDASTADLTSELTSIVATGTVTTAPSQSEVDALAAAVRTLQAQNVTGDSIKSIVGDVFTIINAASRSADDGERSAISRSPLRTVAQSATPEAVVAGAFAAGIAVGIAAMLLVNRRSQA